MVTEDQVLSSIYSIIEEEIDVFEKANEIEVKDNIPETNNIPIENRNKWIKLNNVICVFVDMIGSTKLSAKHHDKTTASAYQLFSNTAVRIFHEMEAKYIDVKGDGVFALFDDNQINRALAAGVTFKTFVEDVFTEKYKDKTKIEIGTHIGIDRKSVLVRKIGLKRKNGRTDRQNEVWAGKPINMAAKLASLSQAGELIVSNRFYNQLASEYVLKSCDCGGSRSDLWSEVNLTGNDTFDFDRAYKLNSKWCKTHGKEYCERIIKSED